MHIKSKLFLLFLPFFFIACDNSLSDREAIKLIEEKGGYPKLKETEFNDIKIQSPLGAEIQRLVDEGYLIPRYNPLGGDNPPTEKGKEIIKSAYWNPSWNRWNNVIIYTHKTRVLQITDKRTTGNNVVVNYSLISEPTPYYEKLKAIDPTRSELVELKPESKEAVFTKWEKGWRVELIAPFSRHF